MSTAIDLNVLNGLLDSVGGDREFLQELVETFFADSPDQFDALRTSLAGGDAETFRRAAHSMKSNSASFGAMALSALFKQLEEIGKSGDLSAAGGLLSEADSAYQQAAGELTAFLEA